MSLKRILGTMLATRMAGRGRRRGSLGTAAMLGGLGHRRRRGMGGKLGVAALGYMAYRAYQDHQSKAGTSSSGSGSARGGSGISGMVQDAMNTLTGGSQPQTGSDSAAANEEDLREEAQAAESISDDKALLLIRAMITAAYSDGSLSTDERQRIMGQIDEAGGDADDRAVMEREIANPKPLDELLAQVNDEETAEEFYMTSRAAVDGESAANQAYLAELQRRLKLSDEQVAEVEEFAT
ncbi:tellurite resistance TerB family protein [Palleronia sp.]|uniref:tellurite resistance TerB family protein n=1 Tax=Palleronia sp. TaxID=1940284 RepID=UPI0035C7FE1E